jgi:hypothetical protein
MSNQITQSQYNTAHQNIRNTYIRVDLLNFQFLTVDSLEGNLLKGSVSIDANSDMRRTCNIELVVTDSSYNVQAGGKIWLDKYIQIYVGIDDIRTGEISWTNMGIYLINQPSYSYDAQTHTLSFQGVDLMAKLTGLRNGYVTGLAGEDKVLLSVGQNIREIIIGILKENGFNRYVVSECKNIDGAIQDIPYEMEFEQGSTWWDVLEALRDILPSYQMYFDADGIFHYDMIPYRANDPIRIDLNTWDNNAISESVDVDFESVKNAIEVYGTIHEPDNFSEKDKTTVQDNIIVPQFSALTELKEYDMIGLVLPEDATSGGGILYTIDGENLTTEVGSVTNETFLPQGGYVVSESLILTNGEGLVINFLGHHSIVNASGAPIMQLAKDTYWVFSYQANGTWLFMGHAQAQAKWQDNNPNSPFYVGSSIGKITLPLYGDDYENIQTDELALERAKYEIYLRCRLNDTINVTTVPIYWADVGWKVNYRPLGGNIINQYLVQSIDVDLAPDGKQTWNLSRFYPLYESF